jgi:thiamine-phosphate pyrophosphorylase
MKTIQDCYLYALTPPRLIDSALDLDKVIESIALRKESIDQGVDIIQLRLKEGIDRQILDLGRQIRRLTAQAGVLFIVNDRLDFAQILDADGLHLGQDDIPLAEARKILGPKKIIGVSTHTPAQAYEAEQEGADYLGYGPCYSTSTKKDTAPGIRLEEITQLCQTLKIPFFIIGGLTLENLPPVIAAGANRIAICAGLYQSAKIRQTIRQIRRLLGQDAAAGTNEINGVRS